MIGNQRSEWRGDDRPWPNKTNCIKVQSYQRTASEQEVHLQNRGKIDFGVRCLQRSDSVVVLARGPAIGRGMHIITQIHREQQWKMGGTSLLQRAMFSFHNPDYLQEEGLESQGEVSEMLETTSPFFDDCGDSIMSRARKLLNLRE